MNFLVHSWLARPQTAHIAGAFLGDFVKGPIPLDLPVSLREGLRLHRHIDSSSNRLEEMRNTYHRFGPKLRRAAPILLDLVADHLLASHWHMHGQGKLEEFTASCYEAISQFEVPENARRMYSHMVASDLWASYANFDVISDIMLRILKRLRLGDHATTVFELESSLDLFYADFCIYFPLLEEISENWMQQNVRAASPEPI